MFSLVTQVYLFMDILLVYSQIMEEYMYFYKHARMD